MPFFGVIGAVGAVGVIGRAVHSNHSNYGDYRDYSDAAERRRIAEEQKRQERENNRKRYHAYAMRELTRLEEEYGCKLFVDDADKKRWVEKDIPISVDNHIKGKFMKHIEQKIEAEIKEDKEELKEINTLLSRVNAIQLTNKK